MAIAIRRRKEIRLIREACRRAAIVMSRLEDLVQPGRTTQELDEFAEEMIQKLKAKPAFKGYRGYPRSICVSINNEVVHGIPSRERVLQEGDIVSIDLGVEYCGFYGDLAVTFKVGEVAFNARSLIQVTKEALWIAINKAVAGNYLGDISYAIQEYVERNGYSVVRRFVGHGIGRSMHEDPEIPNFGYPGTGPMLENGMVLAIEPMVNEGSSEVEILEDGWTAVTKDGKLSCHFEHTVLVRAEEAEVLTELKDA